MVPGSNPFTMYAVLARLGWSGIPGSYGTRLCDAMADLFIGEGKKAVQLGPGLVGSPEQVSLVGRRLLRPPLRHDDPRNHPGDDQPGQEAKLIPLSSVTEWYPAMASITVATGSGPSYSW